MSSAMPMDSKVLEVLLNTSAPSGSNSRTRSLASSPVSTTRARKPLRPSASAAAAIRSSEASRPNSGLRIGSAPRPSASTGLATPELRPAAVDERHGHGSLADGRRAPLDRSMPHVTGRKEAGQVGLERQRLALQGPPSEQPLSADKIASRHQITALVVKESKRLCSLCPRDASDGDEQRIGRKSFRKVLPISCQDQLAKAAVPFSGDDLDPGSDHDVAHA